MTAPTAPELRRLAELLGRITEDWTEEELSSYYAIYEKAHRCGAVGDLRKSALFIASLMDERDRLAAMVPVWINSTHLPNEFERLLKIGWSCSSNCSHYAPDGSWMCLMVPPIPLPAPSTNEPAAKEGA